MARAPDRITPLQLKILLVEDNEGDYRLIDELLSEIPEPYYVVEWSTNFDDALERLRTEHFDLLLFDQQLGLSTGIELLHAAKELGVSTPVILLTGADNVQVDRTALLAGAADFIVKNDLSARLLDHSIRYTLERQRLLEELEAAAYKDALTGLANRRQFLQHLDRALARSRRASRHLGLLLIDLDHFKTINDQLGHEVGDKVLIAVAEMFKRRVRDGDLVARLGGDEFSIVLEDLAAPENAQDVADDLIKVLRSTPISVAHRHVTVGASIGLALATNRSSSCSLIRAADTAMYEAKRAGRSQRQWFCDSMQDEAVRRAIVHQALPKAIADDELRLHFQPQVRATDRKVVAAEALVRWQRGDELVSPSEFVPIAEQCDLIHELGNWVIRAACQQFGDWRARGVVDDEFVLTLNLSANQLLRDSVVDVVGDAIARNHLDASTVELEITESVAMRESEQVQNNLKALEQTGLRLALDDFGTGFSSLSYLSKLPIDTVKIDRSFVQHCETQHEHATLVKGTLGLANSLGLSVVAEGVETSGQRDFLLANGCDVMQGFLFHRPYAAGRFEDTVAPVRAVA